MDINELTDRQKRFQLLNAANGGGKFDDFEVGEPYWISEELNLLSEIFAATTSLKTLTFSEVGMESGIDAIREGLKKNTTLETVTINNVRYKSTYSLLYDFSFPLKSLHIQGCGLIDAKDMVKPLAEYLSRSSSLKHLEISNTVIFEENFDLARGLQKNNSIEELRLKINYFNTSSLNYFALALYGKTHVQRLDITGQNTEYQLQDVRNVIVGLPNIVSLKFTECINKANQGGELEKMFENREVVKSDSATVLNKFDRLAAGIGVRDALRRQDFTDDQGFNIRSVMLKDFVLKEDLGDKTKYILKLLADTHAEIFCVSSFIGSQFSLTSSTLGSSKNKNPQKDPDDSRCFIVMKEVEMRKLVSELKLEEKTTDLLFSL